jgi:hypothetical protein
VVMHHLRATTRRENRGWELGVEMTRNRFDYFRKHYGAHGFAWFRIWMVLGYAARWSLLGVLGRRRPDTAIGDYGAYVRGTLRAAWTGRPERFAAWQGSEVPSNPSAEAAR